MSSDKDDRTASQAADDADESAEMEDKLEQLDDNIDEAAKKADEQRPVSSPGQDDDPIEDAAGGGTDHEEHVDDPEGPLAGPE